MGDAGTLPSLHDPTLKCNNPSPPSPAGSQSTQRKGSPRGSHQLTSGLQPCSPSLSRLLAALPRQFPCRPRQHRWCSGVLTSLLSTSKQTFEALPQVLELLPTLSLAPPDSMSPPSLGRVPPSQSSLQKGLGPVGSAYVPWDLWSSLDLPTTLPPHPPVRPRASSDADTMLHTLASSSLLFPVQPQHSAPAFVTAKTEDKAPAPPWHAGVE